MIMQVMMMMMVVFNGCRVPMFECSVVSEVFKAIAMEMSSALRTPFGPLHRPAREQERVLVCVRPRTQSILVVLAQFQTGHFRRNSRHGLVHLALFGVQDTRVALSEQFGFAPTFFGNVIHPVGLGPQRQKGTMISRRFLLAGSDALAPVHGAGWVDGWDDAAEPLSGPRRHQGLGVGVVHADTA